MRFVRLTNSFRSSEWKHVFSGMLTLAFGSGVARLIGLVCMPILTRIYSPEDYGVLAIFTALVMLLGPIMTLRYSQALPLPKTDAIAVNIFFCCVLLVLFLGLIISIVFWLFSFEILVFFSMEKVVGWWWLIVLGAVAISFYELLSLWATRKKEYRAIANSQIFQSLSGNLVKVLMGFLMLKPLGLMVGQCMSLSAGGSVLLKSFLSLGFPMLRKNVRWARMTFILRYYQDFFWFRLPSYILLALSMQMPVMLMAALFDAASTGQLSLAIMALALPVNLIGQAVARAYYAEVASLGKENIEKIYRLTKELQVRLFLIAIPFSVALYFFSESVFTVVFGRDWATAGTYAAIMAPYILFQLTSAPLDQVVNVIGSQKYFLLVNVLRVIGFSMVFLIGRFYEVDPTTYVLMVSVYLSFFYAGISFFIVNLVYRLTK